MTDPKEVAPGDAPAADGDPKPATVEPPTPEVDAAASPTPLPGVHRGGFSRLPTGPVTVTTTSASGDPEPGFALWTTPEPADAHRGLAGWALTFSIVGLGFAFFVGWGFPIGIVATASAAYALRRPMENRVVAWWALALGVLSLVYSAGWLIWAATHPS